MRTTLLLVLAACFGASAVATEPVRPTAAEAMRSSAVTFTENKGQVSDQHYQPRPDVRFYGSQGPMDFHITDRGISYQLHQVESWRADEQHDEMMKLGALDSVPDRIRIRRVDITWPGCDPNATWTPSDKQFGHTNYYLAVCPDGVTDVLTYGGLTRTNIYPGIDLKYYSKDGHLKYDYVVAPGAALEAIKLQVDGADVSLLPDGSVKLSTPLGELIEEAPIAFQNGKALKALWVLRGNMLSFKVPDRDPAQELVIDPALRIGGTYFGGENSDVEWISHILPLDGGDVTIAGQTTSATGIATVGTHDNTVNGGLDCFLARMNGIQYRSWGTYFGGSASDFPEDIAISSNDRTMLCGWTNSSSGISNALGHQLTFAGGSDGYLVLFNNTTGTRTYGTYFGGPGIDVCTSVRADDFGHWYLAGTTDSDTGITTSGAHMTTYDGIPGEDIGFLAQFNNSGSQNWGTYIPGEVNCMDVGEGQSVFIGGRTERQDGISSTGTHQAELAGATDAFICRFNSAGAHLWGTYIGGELTDDITELVIDTQGDIVLIGKTFSTTGIATFGPPISYQPECILLKFSPDGLRLWGRYGGPCILDRIHVDVDGADNIYIAANGAECSQVSPDAYQTQVAGASIECYVARFNPAGEWEWGTYYGGPNTDYVQCIAVTPGGSIHFGGYTWSESGIASPDAYHTSNISAVDGFFASFCQTLEVHATSTMESCGGAADGTVSVSVIGGNENNFISLQGQNVFGNSALFTGLGSGVPGVSMTYSLVVMSTDANCGGNYTETITISGPPELAADINSNDASCHGEATGSLGLAVTGGTPSYEYLWSNGATTAVVSDLLAGAYSVLVTDTNGCETTVSATIGEPDELVATVTSVTEPLCNGLATGSLDLVVVGGTPTYSYVWSNGSTAQDPSGLEAGPYTFVVTDANGCEASITAEVGEPEELVTTIADIDEPLCNGQPSGSIDLDVTGGTATYTYDWSNGDDVQDPTGLVAGDYTVTVTDANGCTDEAAATVPEPQDLLLTATVTDETNGNDGAIDLEVTGGTPDYSYEWSNESTTEDLDGLVGGVYTVQVSDANGCKDSLQVLVGSTIGMDALNAPLLWTAQLDAVAGSLLVTSSDAQALVDVIDAAGRLVMPRRITGSRAAIPVGHLAPAVYLVRLTTSNGNFSKRMFVGR